MEGVHQFTHVIMEVTEGQDWCQ